MKSFVVVTRKFVAGRPILERHVVAAISADVARTVASNRFGGFVVNVLAN